MGLLFLRSLLTGLLASIPLGPIGLICVQRTVARGRWSGFASGWGAAVADTIFAAVALLGLSYIIDFIDQHRALLQVVGGVVIAILGYAIYHRNPLRHLRHPGEGQRFLQHAFYVMLLTLTNPLAIFLFLALFAAFDVVPEPGHPVQYVVALAGVHIGASSWWYMLTYGVGRVRHRFRVRQLYWFSKISGLVILVSGLVAAVAGAVDLIWRA